MSFWDDLFTRSEKPKKQIVDVNVNSRNAVWLLNEELKRLHRLFEAPMTDTESNLQTVWKRIGELQQKMFELIDKTPDVDTQKQITQIQEQLIEDTILRGDK